MPQWTDGHLDLAYCTLRGRDITGPYPPPDDGCVTLPELRAAEVNLALATIFTEPVEAGQSPREEDAAYPTGNFVAAEACARQQLLIYEDLERRGELRIVRTREDLHRATSQPGIVLLMEGADPIRDASRVGEWFRRGLRIIGLAWARGTMFAGGNSRPAGLSDLGRALVEAIDQHFMVHDASHLADAAFDELLERARGPVIASHSNCRALLDAGNQRHLTDDYIRAIAERGGVIGLNLHAPFVSRNDPPGSHHAIDHVEHIAQVTGRDDCIALGSDMDGGFPASRLLTDIQRPAELNRLADRLSERGWNDEQIDRFRFGNWHRLLELSLPSEAETPLAGE